MKILPASVTITIMKKLRGEQGSADVLLLSVITLAVLFVGAASFGTWAFMGRQDYKNNVDAKIAVAVTNNKKTVQAEDAAQYAEAAKSPVRVYAGPDSYGSVKVSYPKTWSVYSEASSTSNPMDVYFHTDYVPSADSKQTYQLRVQIVPRSYDRELSSYSGLISKGTVTATAYSLPKVSDVIGSKLSGAIVQGSKDARGVMVLVPLRDKTLKVWTESNDYLNDFNTYVLPELTFSP